MLSFWWTWWKAHVIQHEQTYRLDPLVSTERSCHKEHTWVDQKVLKLVAYLHKYTTELHQTYTEYVTTIFWFGNVCQNDTVRSGVHDVIVWWRHATVTRSKKRPKLSFSSEVQLSTFMFNVAVIFSRLLWTWRSIIGTNYYLNMQLQFFYLHLELKDSLSLKIWEK